MVDVSIVESQMGGETIGLETDVDLDMEWRIGSETDVDLDLDWIPFFVDDINLMLLFRIHFRFLHK